MKSSAQGTGLVKLLIKDVSVNINGYHVLKSCVRGGFKIVVFVHLKRLIMRIGMTWCVKKSSSDYQGIY